MNKPYQLGVVTSQMFAENAYFLWRKGESSCIVFDPGMDTEDLLQFLSDQRLTPIAILNTHGHADHIAGNEAIKRCWPDCPLVIGEKEQSKLTDPVANLSAPFGFSIVSPPADAVVNEGDRYRVGDFEFEVYDTPGHSTGHVIFVLKEAKPWVAFVGDVLMRRSVGRTDFPDGSWEDLENSIRAKIYCLPDDTIVLSGHGDPTTVGEEKRFNPFVNETDT